MDNPAYWIKQEDGDEVLKRVGDLLAHAEAVARPGALLLRSVLVCSFSTRTPASAPDRVHGLQEPPAVSPGFKGG